eukprot:GILI01019818.1.p1 GENE.GILI01019818.1~~GILI01019818.1.p1  ORF type:complete len:370 (+),score=47.89 GILI01019818.1:39-1112(+)
MDRMVDTEDATHSTNDSGIEESFLLIDVPVAEREVNYTDNERYMNEQLRVRNLALMVQSLRAAHRKCRIKLFSATHPSEYMLHTWARAGLQKVTHELGSALDGEDVYKALEDDRSSTVEHPLKGPYRTKGIVIFSTRYGGSSNDALMFAAYTTVRRLLTNNGAFLNYSTNVVLQLSNGNATIGPYHADEGMRRVGDSDFFQAPPFMSGKVFSSELLQTILVHSCVTPYIVPFVEKIMNIPKNIWRSAKLADYDERIEDDVHMTRFRVYSNDNGSQGKLFSSYSEARNELLRRRGLICVGVFRNLPSVEEGQARYMITNPPPSLPLEFLDQFYCVTPWAPIDKRHFDDVTRPQRAITH